ncbi:MAG: hypothetical protein M1833_002772 [Piccolia ochrophora]|nr:MAG: hypothetical protein M1833_002772 [Piccolia ochrophora]
MGSRQFEGRIDASLAKELIQSIKNSQVLVPESDGYVQSLKRWSDASIKQAGAVILATSTADVSTTVLFCRDNHLDFAVCGGGHATSGASSSDGGVVIDLSRMRQVVVDTENRTITAQGGCLWADVDTAAGERGLATVGGTVNHTGIGGLTLGGGYGWLTGKYGLVIDNLLEVEVVLADGQVVKASEKENTDLFWALRGAGQNFGVATQFTYRAFEQKNLVWAGVMVFGRDQIDGVVAFANHVAKVSQGDAGMLLVLGTPPLAPAPAIMTPVFFNGPEDKAKDFFAPLLELGPAVNMTSEMPYAMVNGLANAANCHGGRKTMKGPNFSTPIDPRDVSELLDGVTSLLQTIPDATGSHIVLSFLNSSRTLEQAHTSAAFANRGDHQVCIVLAQWTEVEHDSACREWTRKTCEKLGEISTKKKDSSGLERSSEGVGGYGNFNGSETLPSAREIFGVNHDRLKTLKERYDPENIFNKSYAFDLTHA